MSEVRAKIDIDAPPEQVYDVMLDPNRLHAFRAAVERALRDWELVEELAAR